MAKRFYRVVIHPKATVYEVLAESRGEAGDLAFKAYTADPKRGGDGVIEISEVVDTSAAVAAIDLAAVTPAGRGC